MRLWKQETFSLLRPPAGRTLLYDLSLLFKCSHSGWQSTVPPAMIPGLPVSSGEQDMCEPYPIARKLA